MKTTLNKVFLMLLLFGLSACQPSSNNGHGNKSPLGKPQNANWCNAQQRCFSEEDLAQLKQLSHVHFGQLIASLKNMELEENDLIRIKAISLNDAYETLFETSLVDETNEFISELFNFVYEKE